jgi:hypothetical protein
VDFDYEKKGENRFKAAWKEWLWNRGGDTRPFSTSISGSIGSEDEQDADEGEDAEDQAED